MKLITLPENTTMKTCIRYVLTGVLLLVCSLAQAETPVIIGPDVESYDLGQYVDILRDKDNSLQINDVLNSSDFTEPQQKVPNLNITKSTFWVRFAVTNHSDETHYLLKLAYPIIDNVDLYMPNADGGFEVIHSGEKVPITDRKYHDQNFIFDLRIPKGETQTYYLKLKSGEQIMLPLTLSTPKAEYQASALVDLYSGLYFGIVLVMILYNLFVFISVRDRSYLYYVFYILFVGLTQASDTGFTYKFFWPNSPHLANLMVTIFPSLVGTAAILFMRNFLLTRKYIPVADKVFFVLIAMYGVCISLFVLGNHQVGYQMTQMTALTVAVYMIVQAFRIMRKGYQPAKFFIIAWSVFLVSVILFVMKDLGVLPYNNLTKHVLHIGSAVELVLLSLALADKINIMRREKEESQQKTLEALKENERIITEQNVILEGKVKERTIDLQKSNSELSTALTDLKDAQTQLVDAEKMASLGLLTAGIAHEINNPINFVVANINPLKRDIEDIMEVLSKYAEIKDADNLKDKLEEIQDLKEDLDLEYVIQEIGELLKGIDDGAGRTADIVKSLRTFSRLDETDLKVANINECMDSTLVLLNSSLKDIEVVKHFDDIKSIECYPGKLNQLFMNILKNATHAVEHKTYTEGKKPTISIETQDTEDDILIKIADNGTGMDEATMAKIFEPFFTTKDVGEGTGLGLSIAYNIIEKHHGIIEVDSVTGEGTTFVMAIPKQQSVFNEEADKNTLAELKKQRRNRVREGLKRNIDNES